MIQPVSQGPQVQAASIRPDTVAPLAPAATRKLAGAESIATMLRSVQTINLPLQQASIAIDDWDALFCAVQTQLKHAVGEQLGVLPPTPAHSKELAATLVQAIVLDCVGAMDQLHAALKQERSQRSTTA